MFSNGYIAPLVVEVRGDNLEELDEQAQRGRRGRAHACRACATCGRRSQMDYPEVRVDIDREEAGMVGVTRARRGQTTLEATLGNINTPSVWIDSANGQSYYVVTYYDDDAVADPQRSGRSSRCASATTGKPVALGAYGDVRRSVGPIADRAQPAAARRARLMQVEGRDIGTVAARARSGARRDPRTAHVRVRLRRPGRAHAHDVLAASGSRSGSR